MNKSNYLRILLFKFLYKPWTMLSKVVSEAVMGHELNKFTSNDFSRMLPVNNLKLMACFKATHFFFWGEGGVGCLLL